MNIECLFIGGVKDGARINIPIKETRVLAPAPGLMAASSEEYVEVELMPGLRVFRHHTLSAPDALAKLVQGYKGAR